MVRRTSSGCRGSPRTPDAAPERRQHQGHERESRTAVAQHQRQSGWSATRQANNCRTFTTRAVRPGRAVTAKCEHPLDACNECRRSRALLRIVVAAASEALNDFAPATRDRQRSVRARLTTGAAGLDLATSRSLRGTSPSMDGSKPAICGHLKTGHFRRPETGVEIYFTASSVGNVFAGAPALAVTPEQPRPQRLPETPPRTRG